MVKIGYKQRNIGKKDTKKEVQKHKRKENVQLTYFYFEKFLLMSRKVQVKLNIFEDIEQVTKSNGKSMGV